MFFDIIDLFFKMVKKFGEKYETPVLINTSFNLKEEPIVCTPEDAYFTFMRTNIDALILGNFLLEKNNLYVHPYRRV